ncbi:hypothetical protein FB45DRAFT_881192 [Roridomyces roridus]|uniref:Uncharacterized protein n=1 Tax=Roridomyces roridus TaxID=1738132 RepID=A0AAD7AXZ7_9AGAR|nr:hypothetical protein FB45DRAFT_881192 [Roridomyces roridus]
MTRTRRHQLAVHRTAPTGDHLTFHFASSLLRLGARYAPLQHRHRGMEPVAGLEAQSTAALDTTRNAPMFTNTSGLAIHGSQFTNVLGDMNVTYSRGEAPTVREPPTQPLVYPEHIYSDSESYCSQLLRRGRGFPLYIPAPRGNLPAEYGYRGVSIGDVGRVTPEGVFDFFFNIYLPADHPINDNDVPEIFCPLAPYDSKNVLPIEYLPGQHVSTSAVHKVDPGLSDGEDVGLGTVAASYGHTYVRSRLFRATAKLPPGFQLSTISRIDIASNTIAPRRRCDGGRVRRPALSRCDISLGERQISSSWVNLWAWMPVHPSQPYEDGEFFFDCLGPQGAVLALPLGSHIERLDNFGDMLQYTRQNAENWYKYVNGARGRQLSNGSLYLITGWEKARAWGIAAFQEIPPTRYLFRISFGPTFVNSGFASQKSYRWTTSGATRTKSSGPVAMDQTPLNQTVFIHGFSISLGTSLWSRLFGTVEVAPIVDARLGRSSKEYIPYGAQGFSNSIWGFGSFWGSRGAGGHDSGATMSDISPTRACPSAAVVMSHDDDWLEILQSGIPSDASDWEALQLLQSACQGVDVLEENGLAMFSRPGVETPSALGLKSSVSHCLPIYSIDFWSGSIHLFVCSAFAFSLSNCRTGDPLFLRTSESLLGNAEIALPRSALLRPFRQLLRHAHSSATTGGFPVFRTRPCQNSTLPAISELFDPDFLEALIPPLPDVKSPETTIDVFRLHRMLTGNLKHAGTRVSHRKLTQKGAPAYNSTLSATLDAFFRLNRYAGGYNLDVGNALDEAWAEDSVLTLKIIWNLRSIHAGKAEKEVFYWYRLYEKHPRTAIAHLPLLVTPVCGQEGNLTHGCWNDLLVYQDGPTLLPDVRFPSALEDLPLESTAATDILRSFYRRWVLTPLRSATHVTETLMSGKRWKDIPYSRLSSDKRHFFRHDPEGFEQYLSSVEEGQQTISCEELKPHELVEELLLLREYPELGKPQLEMNRRVTQAQWKAVVQNLREAGRWRTLSPARSMTPILPALSLSLLLAQLAKPPFKDRFIAFLQDSQLVTLDPGKGLYETVQSVKDMANVPWGPRMDLFAVFTRLILPLAIENKLKPEEMIKRVFVFSDMQFERGIRKWEATPKSCLHGISRHVQRKRRREARFLNGKRRNLKRQRLRRWETTYDRIERAFKAAGCEVPEIVFWNLGYGATMEVTKDRKGVAMMSGFAPAMLEVFMGREEEGRVEGVAEEPVKKARGDFHPLGIMKKALEKKCYDGLVVVD